MLHRVAEALNEVSGEVLVTGYTDNVPIRTLRFPSNWELSRERAEVVKRMIESRLKGPHAVPNRVRAEGRADNDPVAPNDSVENRARNRRVEVTLLVAPEQTARELLIPPLPAPANPASPARK